MNEKEIYVQLDTIANGGLVERFEDALQRVIENITDPNTDATATRAVTVKLTFKPTKDRRIAPTTVMVEPKLAPQTSLGTTIYIGKDKGKPVATEYNPDQPSFAEIEEKLNATTNATK